MLTRILIFAMTLPHPLLPSNSLTYAVDAGSLHSSSANLRILGAANKKTCCRVPLSQFHGSVEKILKKENRNWDKTSQVLSRTDCVSTIKMMQAYSSSRFKLLTMDKFHTDQKSSLVEVVNISHLEALFVKVYGRLLILHFIVQNETEISFIMRRFPTHLHKLRNGTKTFVEQILEFDWLRYLTFHGGIESFQSHQCVIIHRVVFER